MEDPALWAHLACRITQGDREAEDELARTFYPRVKIIASARLHGSDAALDIAQDTVVAAIEALRADRLREPERLPAFVLGIARNLINNYHRADATRREHAVDESADPAGDDHTIARIDDARRRALVRDALAQLNAVDRRILRLTLNHGMTPREIAPMVGLTSEVVRTRKSRAVKAMAEAVKAHDTKPAAGPLVNRGIVRT